MLVGLNKLDHEPLEDDGDDRAGGIRWTALGDGLALDHIGERGLCLACGSRL